MNNMRIVFKRIGYNKQAMIELVFPHVAYRSEFLAMLEDYRQAREYYGFHEGAELDFEAYVQHLRDQAAGVNLRARFVPQSVYWLVQDGKTLLGESRLRHRLTPWLAVEGGHIGYNIRPPFRCQGHGTELLRLTLEKARDAGLTRVFITCDTDNVASARIIETNGGELQAKIISAQTGKMKSQYWINL